MEKRAAEPESIQKKIDSLAPWFHNLHLPNGIQTAPEHFLGDFPAYKWQELAIGLPDNLAGWTALDVGCNAGFYSFELARRGAYVTAIDSNAHYLRQARWAAEQFGLAEQIQFCQRQVYDLAGDTDSYDLVLFLGVMYHLRYPLLGLDIVTQKARRLFCFQSMTLPGTEVFSGTDGRRFDERELLCDAGWPKMAFIEGRFADDPTNWWVPNHACIEAMLRTCGMQVVSHPGHELYICKPDPSTPGCAQGWNRHEYETAIGHERRASKQCFFSGEESDDW
ncbi:TIGR04290 family methyltransferase [Nitrosococcus wardiae]|uniref:TIGR04290 family methyltransferase n=1 Tax=Nitrosococcus wardiae TaxID=1814290 RepID=A0A4P7C2J0_9GAMM|nr:TIGR04290 family methyltransferase [Nitrosococcus wardiae]QBQ55734.1 TIGR04290 family methyltransferase [Nitrosococcus wardiae]